MDTYLVWQTIARCAMRMDGSIDADEDSNEIGYTSLLYLILLHPYNDVYLIRIKGTY